MLPHLETQIQQSREIGYEYFLRLNRDQKLYKFLRLRFSIKTSQTTRMSARLRKGFVQELSSLCTLKFFILTLEVSLILKPRLLVSFTILESFQMKCSHALVLPVTMGKHWPLTSLPLLILWPQEQHTKTGLQCLGELH